MKAEHGALLYGMNSHNLTAYIPTSCHNDPSQGAPQSMAEMNRNALVNGLTPFDDPVDLSSRHVNGLKQSGYSDDAFKQTSYHEGRSSQQQSGYKVHVSIPNHRQGE